jgi:hypothetical protein
MTDTKHTEAERKRKATIWFVIIFVIGGSLGLWYYIDWLHRACGGEGC